MRKDVFAVLPTGFGKSVIFQVIPSICSMLAICGLNYPEKPIIVLICPLVSLINSHIQELRSRGFSAACLPGDNIDEKGIEQGDYSFIFASPESVIRNEKWRKMLRTTVYQERLFGLVTDEAHVIPKWYKFCCLCALQYISLHTLFSS